ncbi:SulP family inorganic anion transporter [Desulfotomaculum copahuensis]|uniref:STAS domain-containing protein n=1 Tax=Desulfotomaculum copahuensis TaxID=1838280 RepID=A0A1B7LIZ6_9FIRM|nr:SulP family inorganic anion transporter [Desulfotomaculum copahuensis]OAT86545.1 hypothetical protein A6M21_02905 [Desulfotomaculum copahuensis]
MTELLLKNDFIFKPVKGLIRAFDKGSISFDFMAAITVMIVGLPQAMAYAMIAKINPVYGLYGAIVMAVVGSLLGSSNHLVTGPTNAICILIAGVMFPFFSKSASYPFEVLFLLTFMVGLIQLLFSVFKLGALINYVPHSLIVGFTAGAGVLIAMQQVNTFFGITVPQNINMPTFAKVVYTFQHISATNYYALAIAAATMVIIIACRIIGKKFPGIAMWLPGPLLGVIASTAVVMGMHLDKLGVKICGNVPSAYPPFHMLHFSLSDMQILFSGALTIAIVGLMEAIAISKSIASLTGQRIDTNQEIFGQSMANMIGSFFSCFPGSGSFTRSAVNYGAGAKSRLAGIMSGVLVLAMLLVFKPFIKYIPNASLAGVLMIVAYTMIDKRAFKEILKLNRSDAVIMLTTAVVTVVAFQIEYAIYIGVMLAVILFLKQTGRASIKTIIPLKSEHGHLMEYEVQSCNEEKCEVSPVAIIEPEGNLYFGLASDLERRLDDFAMGNAKVFIMRFRNVSAIDVTALEVIRNFVRNTINDGKAVLFSDVNQETYDILDRAGIVKMTGKENIFLKSNDLFFSTKNAIDRANVLLDNLREPKLLIRSYV